MDSKSGHGVQCFGASFTSCQAVRPPARRGTSLRLESATLALRNVISSLIAITP